MPSVEEAVALREKAPELYDLWRGPRPYIADLIAVLDLVAMLGLFFGLRPDHLSDSRHSARKRLTGALTRRRRRPRITNNSARPRGAGTRHVQYGSSLSPAAA
jgi:hypothetical protein